MTTVQRAFGLLYRGCAKAVFRDHTLFDFQEWRLLDVQHGYDALRIISGHMLVPRVILLTGYDRLPRRHVRFSRRNIYMRDKYTCQYCGLVLSASELTLDHVVPRSQGGATSWENMVACCATCNRLKGGRTPAEARLRLQRAPRRPEWTALYGFRELVHEEWRPFLCIEHGNAPLLRHDVMIPG